MKLIDVKSPSEYLTQDRYFQKLKAQLSKDFSDSDFDNELAPVKIDTPNDLPVLVNQFLNQLFNKSIDQFFQLMYKVDIPDTDIKNQIITSGIDMDALTELVLKRELLKILLREKYSS
tara:strand:- start:133 stop:486 length:354 start_codon:yes stop_codon:yes gene_type:complete